MKSLLFIAAFTATHMTPVTFLHHNTTKPVYSTHEYTIPNDTDDVKNVNFCYQISTCTEWPYWIKTSKQCENITINPHSTAKAQKTFSMDISYPITGWCTAIARTELTGDALTASEDKTQFQIGN